MGSLKPAQYMAVIWNVILELTAGALLCSSSCVCRALLMSTTSYLKHSDKTPSC